MRSSTSLRGCCLTLMMVLLQFRSHAIFERCLLQLLRGGGQTWMQQRQHLCHPARKRHEHVLQALQRRVRQQLQMCKH